MHSHKTPSAAAVAAADTDSHSVLAAKLEGLDGALHMDAKYLIDQKTVPYFLTYLAAFDPWALLHLMISFCTLQLT